jgi:hypothetical protein
MSSRKHSAFLLVALALLFGGAVFAEFNAGCYTAEEPGEIHQTLPRTDSPGSTYEVGAYSLYRPVLAPGDGRSNVESYCNTCHSPRYITMQPPLPADQWEAEVNKMIKTYGASIPSDSTQNIIHYLQAHYTPKNRKR